MKYSKFLYLFIILTMGMVLLVPSLTMAKDESYGLFNLIAKDHLGLKVEGVGFVVFEQEFDINNNRVLGKKVASGKIDNLGQAEVKIKFDSSRAEIFAVKYYIEDRENRQFILWDQVLGSGQIRSANLSLSSVRIVFRNTDGGLVKDLPFDLYSAVTDVLGNKVADKKLYDNKKTDKTGEQIFYLVPGNYILKIRYPDVKYENIPDYNFTVYANQQTNIDYTLNTVKIGQQIDGKLKPNADYRLYMEEEIWSDNYDYKLISQSNTGKYGYKEVYLPQGDYLLEFKDSLGKYTKDYQFQLDYGDEEDFVFHSGDFVLTILNPDEEPLANLTVKIYKYKNVYNQDKILETRTDSNGEIGAVLIPGSYSAEIESVYRGIFYKIDNFYVSDYEDNDIEYTLSTAKIYIQDANDNDMKNQTFTIYQYMYSAANVYQLGEKIGTFSTSNKGFSEIYLAPGRYVVKAASNNKTYPIFVEQERANIVYLNTATGDINNWQPYYGGTTIMTLFPSDNDNDGLTDFEEFYFYGTDAYKADTDNDGYSDFTEIKNYFNPNGSGRYYYPNFSYDRPRLRSLNLEQELAKELKTRLEAKLGKGNIQINAKDWHTVVNSFIYGGYSVEEIANTIVYGPGQVHPNIPASAWRQR